MAIEPTAERGACAHPGCEAVVNVHGWCYGCGAFVCSDHSPNDCFGADHTPSAHWSWSATSTKTCECGIAYDAASWLQLVFVGVMHDDVETLVLKNCTCGSTLAVAVDAVVFMRQVRIDSSCWVWLGSASRSTGYGVVYPGSQKRAYAHRTSFTIFRGPIPGRKLVCHTCDVRLCVNPSHLFIGTISDNIKDMWRKGRGHPIIPQRGSKHHRAILNEAAVRSIRDRIASGEVLTTIARSFHVSLSTISLIKRGKIWKEVSA